MYMGQISRNTITILELQENNFDFGLKDYEIFDEEYRPLLNNAILEYYKFREIGFINPAVFKDRLNQRMNLIMRNKYNSLYKAKMTEFNPLYNIELHETFTHEITNTNNSNSISDTSSSSQTNSTNKSTDTNNSNNLSLNSSFPSEELTEDDLTDNLFVDNAAKNKSTTENTNSTKLDSSASDSMQSNTKENSNGNMTESYTKTTQGSSAGLPFSKALIQLKEFQEKYQLDIQVIAELSDLFYSLY